MEHPYPDHAYLERDSETNEKRWFSIKGMGVRYVHEDRAAEDIEAAIAADRKRFAQSIIEQIDIEIAEAPDAARTYLANVRTACLRMLPETNS